MSSLNVFMNSRCSVYALIAQIFFYFVRNKVAKCLAASLRCNTWPTCPSQKETHPSLPYPSFVFCFISVSFAQKSTQACSTADCCLRKARPLFVLRNGYAC